MKQTKEIVNSSYTIQEIEIDEAKSVGWILDTSERPPVFDGFLYSAVMHRELADGEQPKLTRAEILAKAREAKAAKKTTQQE